MIYIRLNLSIWEPSSKEEVESKVMGYPVILCLGYNPFVNGFTSFLVI